MSESNYSHFSDLLSSVKAINVKKTIQVSYLLLLAIFVAGVAFEFAVVIIAATQDSSILTFTAAPLITAK